ncbi:MAG: Dickkopf N-terminal cysteine-rich domain-containing protein [Bradymonadia bacterium]
MKARFYLCVLSILALILFGCGDDTRSSGGDEAAGGAGGMAGDGRCYTDDECTPQQYCRADDPTQSPEGSCTALEVAGGPCALGTQCEAGLVCVRTRGEAAGACTPFPAECSDSTTCMCAQTLCDALAGSSCSLGVVDDPASSMTVSCP